jgi:hypothetical protein
MSINYYQEFKEGKGDFYAKDDQKMLGLLRVNFSEKKFPYILSINILEDSEGEEILETLLKRANDFYWHFSKNKLRSISGFDSEKKDFWKDLERKDLVEMVLDSNREDYGRWIFK